MNLELPKKSEVNKFIPKSKFFTKATVNTKTKQLFTDSIQKIVWRYKLSKETINVSGTDSVEEIQIFEVELKDRNIPKGVLQIIDKAIPYPILYVFTYRDFSSFGMVVRDSDTPKYYFSDWNEPVAFDFNGNDLEQIYQKIIRGFIKSGDNNKNDFKALITLDVKKDRLEKEILALERKLKLEKQFKKQMEINRFIRHKKKELNEIKKEL